MSNWEDTVMSDKELELYHFKPMENKRRVAEAQAEASFKAGREVGIRGVVEWLMTNAHKVVEVSTSKHLGWQVHTKDWQDKLKEWGIE